MQVFLFNPNVLQKVSLVNKARTYNNCEFEIVFDRFEPLDQNYSFFKTAKDCYIYSGEKVKRVGVKELELTATYTVDSGHISAVRATADDRFVVTLDNDATVELPEKPTVATDAADKGGQPAESSAVSSPLELLNAFTRTNISDIVVPDYSNFIMHKFPRKLVLFDKADFSRPSHAAFAIGEKSEIVIFRGELRVLVPKKHAFAAALLGRQKDIKEDHLISQGGDGQSIELTALEFKGSRFSKSMHLSNVLFRDNEFYSTQNFQNLFMFENSFEKTMGIRRFNIRINECFAKNGPVSDILIFVFDDLALAGELQRYRAYSKTQWQVLIADNQLPESLKPVLILNIQKNAQLGHSPATEKERRALLFGRDQPSEESHKRCIYAELSSIRYGRYVAIIPLKKAESVEKTSVFGFEYVGVEGVVVGQSASESHPVIALKNTDPINVGLQVSYEDQVFTPEVKVTTFVEQEEDLLVTAFTEQIITQKQANEFTITVDPKGSDFSVTKFIPEISSVNDLTLMKIKKEISENNFGSITKILNFFYKKYIGGEAKDTASVEHFLRLVLFLAETFGKNFVDVIPDFFSFETFLKKFVCALPRDANSKLFSIFFDKLSSFHSTFLKIKESFLSVLDDYSAVPTSPRAQQLLWFLVASALETDKKDADFATKVARFHAKVLGHINRLHGKHQKILDITNINYVLTDAPFENSDKSSKSLVLQEENKGGELSIPFHGFEHSDTNCKDFYFLFSEPTAVSAVNCLVSDVKLLLPFTVNVYCMERKNQFKLVKSKTFDVGFCHQVVKSQAASKAKSFAFNLSSRPVNARLLRIAVRVNYFATFPYSNIKSIPSFKFSFEGTPSKVEALSSAELAYYQNLQSEF